MDIACRRTGFSYVPREQRQRALWEDLGGVCLAVRIWMPVAKISRALRLGGCGGGCCVYSEVAVFAHLGSHVGISELIFR